MNKHYPEGIKYRARISENGETLFGFDNHNRKVLISILAKLKWDMFSAEWMNFVPTLAR